MAVGGESKSLIISKAHPAVVSAPGTGTTAKEGLSVLPLFGSDVLKSFHHALRLFGPMLER